MDILSVLFSQQTRKIGAIVPSVAISEKHSDTLEITEHPIEDGAPVSDHAYKRPPEVTMELGFAGGGSLLDGVDTTQMFNLNSGLSLGTSPREVYQQLVALQESRIPFDVTTGKRQYQNMLIKSLDVTTDKISENVLMCSLTLRNVIISRTQSVTVADKANMADGVSTSAVQNSGTKSAKPINESLLSQGQRGILALLGGGG
ncbi:phage baseplate protein [Serratia grimesii]|uniref:phage baseplate protein n=1 Tax=Serratia grimesii TaxID=82995 RepID=UPI0039AF3E18